LGSTAALFLFYFLKHINIFYIFVFNIKNINMFDLFYLTVIFIVLAIIACFITTISTLKLIRKSSFISSEIVLFGWGISTLLVIISFCFIYLLF